MSTILGSVLTQELSWDESIQTVLRGADQALHYAAIAQRISTDKLRKEVGPNPAATVAAVISASMRGRRRSPYLRVGPGEYQLRPAGEGGLGDEKSGWEPAGEAAGALRSFGMFWKRDWVMWSGRARMLGRQGPGARAVNFAEQVGVYLLHDRERVIYVGRAGDALFGRLKSHTTDRLGGRWDRFSWFGLRGVNRGGVLTDPATAWSRTVVIETLEALLIESLEPPLNRKRGDGFPAAEFLQVEDPELVGQRKKQLLLELGRSLGID